MTTATKLFFGLSLALNAGLAVVLVRGSLERTGESAANATPRVEAPKPAAVAGPSWQDLPQADIPKLIARLEQEGFPRHLVAAIVRARVQEQFAERRRALQRNLEGRYWVSPTDDPAVGAQLRELSREQRAMVRQLLGRDLGDEMADVMLVARGLGFVPPERGAAVRQLLMDFDEQRRELFESSRVGDTISAGMVESKLAVLEKAQRAELAKVLTPEEMERFDLSASRTASRLRFELSAFDPSEEEYRRVFRLRQAFDEQYGQSTVNLTQEQQRAYRDAQKQLTEQIKQALGPERGAEYERAADYSYRSAVQLVERLQLPRATANEVYKVQKDIEARRNEAMRNAAGSGPNVREEMTQTMTALQQEAIEKLTPLLGARGVEAYRQYGGQWLDYMVPPPPRPSPKR